MARIENRTFDELGPRDTKRLVRTLTCKDIEVFAIMPGDVNPAHAGEDYAKSDMFHMAVAHGMRGGAATVAQRLTKLRQKAEDSLTPKTSMSWQLIKNMLQASFR